MLTLRAWALLAAGIGVDSGQMHWLGLPLVVAAWVVLARLVWRGGEQGVPTGRDLAAPVAVVVLAVVLWRPVWYASGPWLGVSHVLAALTVAAALWAARSASLPAPRPAWALPPRAHWALPAALGAAATVAMVLAAPEPRIDVWVFGQQAAEAVLSAENPYTQRWVDSPGLQAVYPYLPLTTVLLAPWWALLGDVRYGVLAALLLASWAARRIVLPRPAGPASPAHVLVPLLLLLIPRWTWSVAQAWTEPLLLAALAGAVWAACRGRSRVAVVLLAAALACKQHVALLLPLLARWSPLGPRRTAAAAALAGLVVLPWFVVDPAAFWHDAVSANLALEPKTRSLGLAALAELVGLPWGFWVTGPAVLAAGVVVARRLGSSTEDLLLGSAFLLLTLDLVNQQSFFNHYTLPLGLLVLAVAVRTGTHQDGSCPAEDYGVPGGSRSSAATGGAQPRGL